MKNLFALGVVAIVLGGVVYVGGSWQLRPMDEQWGNTAAKTEDSSKNAAKETETESTKETEKETGGEIFGGYPYQCEEGGEFTMVPNTEVTSITLVPGEGSQLWNVTLTRKESAAGARFEGSGVVFVGTGEEVQLRINEMVFSCHPKPTGEAPFNWGDPAEGGGESQDISVAVTANIVGKWQSTEDTKFTREFIANGAAIDMYDNESPKTSTWDIFTSKNPPQVSFTVEENVAYVVLKTPGAADMYFKVIKLTPEELQLVYMDSGGGLSFTRVQ